MLKMNKRLRDYDFKKNLELKEQLCKEAKALEESDDIIGSFKKLQEFHNLWREIGHTVAKELREELWARFKESSSVINKKYQTFFEERKEKEKESKTKTQNM